MLVPARSLPWLLPALALAPVAHAGQVELTSGEVLLGEVLQRSSAGVSLQHPLLGRLWISGEHVASVDGEPLRSPIEAAAAREAARPVALVPDPAQAPPSPWKYKVELGASGKQGNNDQADLRAAISAAMEDAERRWKLSTVYQYSETDDEKTKNQSDTQVRRDWLIPDSPWFYFANGRYEWDEFQDWDGRIGLGGGVGRDLVKQPDFLLRARAGAAAVRESGSEDDDWRPEGVLGLESEWKIDDGQELESSLSYHPDFDDTQEYRVEVDLGYSVKIANLEDVRLKLGLRNEYDSHRTKPFDRNDFEYYLALLWEF